MRRGAIVSAASLALLLAGCASSGLQGVWRDPAYAGSPMTNVLVIAMKRDPVRRRLWEDGLVGPLSRHAMTATPSYLRFPNALPDTQQVREVVRARAYDGVIVVSRLPNDVEHKVVLGPVETVPGVTTGEWTSRYTTYWVQQQQAPSLETQQVVRLVVELWTTEHGGRVVWTATGHSVDPTSVEQVKRELADSVVPALEKQKLIPPQSK